MADLKSLLNKKKKQTPEEDLGIMSSPQAFQSSEFMSLAPEEQVKETLQTKLKKEAQPKIDEPKVVGTKEHKQAVKQRAKVNKAAKDIKDIKKADKSINVLDELKKQYKNVPEISNAKKEIEQAYKDAKAQYEKDKDENKWLQVAETLGQAMVQLGAGAYGLKHGVDMSGIKFNKTDWSKNLDNSLNELKLAAAKRDKDLADLADPQAKKLEFLDRIAKIEGAQEDRKSKKELAQMKQDTSKPTTFDKVVEKQAAEFMTKGRRKLEKNLDNINKAIELLEKEETGTTAAGLAGRTAANIGGRLAGAVGAEKLGKGLTQGAEVQRLVEQSQQASIGEVLDAQFAAREADQVLKRSFDPTAPKDTQLKILREMQQALQKAKLEGDAVVEHIKAGKSPKDFKSPINSDFIKRKTKDGKIALFDSKTKKFVKYEGE